MPDLNRIACTRCMQSVYNCLIEGPDGQEHRVPIVTRINQGQPDDTGMPLDLNGENVRVTSFTRANMATPVPRLELCEKCLSEVMGWPLVTAQEDPMYSAGVSELNRQMEKDFRDESKPKVERFRRQHVRALHAPAVAWGEATPADLPPEFQPLEKPTAAVALATKEEPLEKPTAAVALATKEELEAELARRESAEA